jgi:hypothetical protein
LCLEKYELSLAAQKTVPRRLAHEITVKEEPDTDSTISVAMPEGNVIDLEALAAVMGETREEAIGGSRPH